MAESTALYRFYDDTHTLLYIGITGVLPRRLKQHASDKPWFHRVADIRVEHWIDRNAALAAEKSAIIREQPLWNVVHNHGRALRSRAAGRWAWRAIRTGHERVGDLWLEPEISCTPMVDDYCELSGEGQLQEWVNHMVHRYPQELDAIPIYWFVRGSGTCEYAPFAAASGRAFLDDYSWPSDVKSGEMLDWFKLPIRWRHPEFAAALDWMPSRMQPSCPLRSILLSRSGAVDA